MRRAGRSARYVFGIWGGIALCSGAAAYGGYEVLGSLGPGIVAATMGVAAGAILTMLADTMLPEAFEHAHELAGLIRVGVLARVCVAALVVMRTQTQGSPGVSIAAAS